jgi:nitrogen fixation protein NifU and related proteins
MSDLRELYQQVILDHNRKPRNFGDLEGANRFAHGDNPLCGDKIQLLLKVDDANVVQDVKFKGSGCAISTASASLMTEAIKGKSVDAALKLFDLFHEMVTSDLAEHELDDSLGKLAVFYGVREFPVRVKCASLSWHTAKAALTDSDAKVSTEA